MKITLTKGNHKLSNKFLIFSLPSEVTCPGAGQCKEYCYAKKAERLYPTVLPSRMKNYNSTLSPYFVDNMCTRLEKEHSKGYDMLRLHSSGDFYNQEYLDKWKSLAAKIPDMTISTFSKSMNLDLYNNTPDNMIIIQSYGSKHDDKIDTNKNTARVIKDIKDIYKRERLCPYHRSDFSKCGEYCSYCLARDSDYIKHVGFMKH